MFKQLRAVVVTFVLLTLLTGVAYPLLVTLISQLVFSHQANGSMVYRESRPAGSELIGQAFDAPQYFWGRPSGTSPSSYNAAASSGTNLGPTNPGLLEAVQSRVDLLRKADSTNKGPVPVELVTASASGLDPHISPQAAEYQVGRVAKARGISPDAIRQLVRAHTEGRTLGVLGEPRINVLLLNLDLDKATAPSVAAASVSVEE